MDKLIELHMDASYKNCSQCQDFEGEQMAIKQHVKVTTDVAINFADWIASNDKIRIIKDTYSYNDVYCTTQELFDIFVNETKGI
jgi:hypothetical protein